MSKAFHNRAFSHVANFTGYMAIATDAMCREAKAGGRILDMPAGNGMVSDELRRRGFDAVPGDINRERPDFVYTDMSKPLPFEDASFDGVMCLEGIEHMLEPFALMREMFRILRPGGVLTTPNVMSLYSRLHFLFYGSPYQFAATQQRRVPWDVMEDRGHIAPMSYLHLRYYTQCLGGEVIGVEGDKTKRKVLYPLYFLLWGAAWWASRGGSFGPDPRWPDPRWEEARRHVLSRPVMLARSLVYIARKKPS
jgi:SAM-dependent methyltransferase